MASQTHHTTFETLFLAGRLIRNTPYPLDAAATQCIGRLRHTRHVINHHASLLLIHRQ